MGEDMRGKIEVERQRQRASQSIPWLYYGVPNGKRPRTSPTRSEPRLPGSYLTEEEKEALFERMRNPIWDKILDERAADERKYWKWSKKLRDNAECAVDHIFTGPRGGQTDVQRELLEKKAAEKRYWKWAASLRPSATA